MFGQRSPYTVLGVSPQATKREIRKTYRVLVKKYHPDRNPQDPEAEAKFKEVQWAYETLISAERAGPPSRSEARSESAFSQDVHPFVSFFSAMREYSKRKKGA